MTLVFVWRGTEIQHEMERDPLTGPRIFPDFSRSVPHNESPLSESATMESLPLLPWELGGIWDSETLMWYNFW